MLKERKIQDSLLPYWENADVLSVTNAFSTNVYSVKHHLGVTAQLEVTGHLLSLFLFPFGNN